MTTTIRVSRETRDRIALLAATTNKRMNVVLDEAVQAYERTVFWEELRDGYERLAADADGAAEVETERRREAGALRDGLT